MTNLQLPDVPDFDTRSAERAKAHQLQLTKPPGSLGRLEELAVFYAGARGTFPVPTPARAFLPVFGADHGVTAEQISAFPAQLTTPILQNVVNGGAAINVLARQHQVELLVVDVGITGELTDGLRSQTKLVKAKIRRGTRNLRVEDAMSESEAISAITAGMDTATHMDPAVDVVAMGEVGIGNTTASAALIAAFTGEPAESVTGSGTGLDAVALLHKIAVVRDAVVRLEGESRPLRIAAALGGLEILAMAGFAVRCASQRIPILLDGVIASAAALVAQALCPGSTQYFVASHRSTEPGIVAAQRKLGLVPLFDLGMRLGEGTGAVLGISLLRSAVALANEMATFESAGLA